MSSMSERLLGQLVSQMTGMNQTMRVVAQLVGRGTHAAAAGRPPEKPGGGGFEMRDIAQKLLLAIAPIAALSSVVAANTSGMQVFLSSVKVAGAVIGSLLAPAFISLSALMLTFADITAAKILPNYEKFATVVISGFISAIDAGEKAFWQFIGVMKDVMEFLKGTTVAGKSAKAAADMPIWAQAGIGIRGLFGDGVANAMGFNKGAEDAQVKLAAQRVMGGRERNPGIAGIAKDMLGGLQAGGLQAGGPGGDFGAAFRKNLQLSMQEFRFQQGPQAQQMGIAQASMTAQMNALSMSPFEQKMSNFATQTTGLLERLVSRFLHVPTD